MTLRSGSGSVAGPMMKTFDRSFYCTNVPVAPAPPTSSMPIPALRIANVGKACQGATATTTHVRATWCAAATSVLSLAVEAGVATYSKISATLGKSKHVLGFSRCRNIQRKFDLALSLQRNAGPTMVARRSNPFYSKCLKSQQMPCRKCWSNNRRY